MLNGQYDTFLDNRNIRHVVRYTDPKDAGRLNRLHITVMRVWDNDESRAAFGAVQERIHRDGGTLFDKDANQYIVGDIEQLSREGR